MAPISDADAAVLDSLREQILKAQGFLAGIPVAEGEMIMVMSSSDPDNHGDLRMSYYMGVGEHGVLYRMPVPLDDQEDHEEDSLIWTKVLDLKVNERLKYAAKIGALIAQVKLRQSNLPSKVKKIADEIASAMND